MERSEPDTSSDEASSAARRPCRVLLVEDETLTRKVLCLELRAMGLHVECAADGHEALRLVYSLREPIDVVLTDVMMPGPNGPEVAAHALARWPNARAIIMSSYSREQLLHDGRIHSGQATLQKPFDHFELEERLRDAGAFV